MAGWVCHICGWRYERHELNCNGCGHSGSSIEEFVDCPDCQAEVKASRSSCDSCGASLRGDDLDFDDDSAPD